jgi:hypothetical protein
VPDKEERETRAKAKKDLREGKSASTAAGEFVREEVHHIREGKHGAKSSKQAIAIGLSKARRAGVPLKAPAKGETSESTRENAEHAVEAGKHPHTPSASRSRASRKRLKKEPHSAASHRALSRQAHRSARRRGGSKGR